MTHPTNPDRVTPVDPGLLERLRKLAQLPGCNLHEIGEDTESDPNATFSRHSYALIWAPDCPACLTLLVRSIASEVEAQTIERCAAECKGVETSYYGEDSAVDTWVAGDCRKAIRSLPRQWSGE